MLLFKSKLYSKEEKAHTKIDMGGSTTKIIDAIREFGGILIEGEAFDAWHETIPKFTKNRMGYKIPNAFGGEKRLMVSNRPTDIVKKGEEYFTYKFDHFNGQIWNVWFYLLKEV